MAEWVCVPLQRLRQQLNAPGYVYDPGLRDQNAIVYMLKKEWARHKAHVLTISKQYCMNCYWRDLLELGDLRSDESRVSHGRRACVCVS